jgi:hypothetical protein
MLILFHVPHFDCTSLIVALIDCTSLIVTLIDCTLLIVSLLDVCTTMPVEHK